ncbi:hypothetical protein CXG81DRAFT_13659 [Caulochytrium protostelioides]|uniref:Protein-serine/threonine kinase n=1 Tax=Caulochytrium protostelioides TaxID=1555241 RepID=A0A4P9X4T0_9FUNG|nr:hypothetical protein CXG81DRAFT_13659 [Caulochytrium protostelioides]|eukprot:RKP00080.1 hypothetical protein CXG81DRAFT_13659 [Caulochytrium protostelioides]
MAATPSRFSSALLEKIKHYATFQQTPVSLRQMVEFGHRPSQLTLLRATQFVHHELPIRLAHRVVELDALPHALSEMPSVQRVKHMYTQSFKDLIDFPEAATFGVPDAVLRDKPHLTGRPGWAGIRYFNPPKDPHAAGVPPPPIAPEIHAYNDAFVNALATIKTRHDPVVTAIAQGIIELKEHWARTNSPMLRGANPSKALLPTAIQAFLDRFFMSRIGIRILIGQQIALNKAATDGESNRDYVGIICTKTNLGAITQDAIDNARFICQEYYGLFDGPQVRMIGQTDIHFMYVPSHLHHMLFELLKNSLRAVVERHGIDADSYPEIRVVVAAGKEDLTIKISDEGGGIPRSGMPLIWTYMYTTAEHPSYEEGYNKSDFRAPLAGFGYGLPLSRLYARYFGGDLRLISMEGYGTDAYLHLNRLSDTEEPLM